MGSKPWVAYGHERGIYDDIGLVSERDESNIYIIYSENQIYSPQCWSVKHTKRFETLDEAVQCAVYGRGFNEFDKYGSRSCWYKFEYDELYAKIKLRFPKFMGDPKNEKHCII